MEESKKKQKADKASKKPEKLHVEIAAGNWKGVTQMIDTYNASPERLTPKIKPADVVNKAVAIYLGLV